MDTWFRLYADAAAASAAPAGPHPQREPAELALVGGKLVLPGGVRDGALTIRNGLIDQIVLSPEAPPPAQAVRDVGGAYVLPGLIDSHVHFRNPGMSHKERWFAASRAAVAGGVTTVIDMPNTAPYYSDPRDLPKRIAGVEGQSLVDFAFHLGVSADSVDRLEEANPAATPSVKVFLAGHHTARHIFREDADLERLFRVAAHKG